MVLLLLPTDCVGDEGEQRADERAGHGHVEHVGAGLGEGGEAEDRAERADLWVAGKQQEEEGREKRSRQRE